MFPFLVRLKTRPPSSFFNTLITRPPHRLFHVTLPVFKPKTTKDLEQCITTQTHLSTTLAAHLFTNKYPNSNVVFCPITVHVTLSNIAAEAKGKTLQQLLGFLKTNSKDELDHWLHYYDFSNISVPKNGLGFNIAFNKKLLMGGYDADVSKVTRAEFKHLYRTKGIWFEEFDFCDIKYSDFYPLDGSKGMAPYMVSKKKHLFAEFDDFKVLGFPHFVSQEIYKFTVYMFLPKAKDGLGSLIEKMRSTPDFIDTHIPDKKVEMGEVSIPMLQILTDFDVADVLKEFGVVLPFSGVKDGLSDMVDATCNQNVSVCGIHHRFGLLMLCPTDRLDKDSAFRAKYVAWDGCSQTIKDKVEFIANRPFVFVIRDDVTKVVFFMGQVINPLDDPGDMTI